MPAITFDTVYTAMKNLGYTVYEKDIKPYNLNIIGIRNQINKPNQFDDTLVVMWKFKGSWNFLHFEITTDPGLYWLNQPMNPLGTAILKEGQYKGSHKLGKHKGYKALQQQGPVIVYRDANRDNNLNMTAGTEQEGYFGINIHRARLDGKSINVNKWSAGCQVFASSADFDVFMKLCDNAVAQWGNGFSYTLINSKDL